MRRALVTGASGFLGRHLVSQLLEASVPVRAILRPARTGNGPDARVEVALADGATATPSQLQPLMDEVDLVFHLAAHLTVSAPFGAADDSPLYQRVNVDFTAALLAAARQAGVTRFVYASSSSVYAPDNPVPTPETGRLGPISPYGRSKLAAERLVRAAAGHSLETTIIRIPVMYGPGDGTFTPTALRLARLPLLPLVGGGYHRFDLVYVEDVARLLCHAAAASAASGGIFNAGPPAPTTLRDLVEAYRRHTGRGPRVMPASPALLRVLSSVSRPLLARLAPGAEAALTPAGVRLMSREHHLDIGLATRVLGFRPTVGLDNGLARTLAAGW